MKKITRPLKLTLKHETLKALQLDELDAVIGGGVTDHCTHPTTTVLPTGSC